VVSRPGRILTGHTAVGCSHIIGGDEVRAATSGQRRRIGLTRLTLVNKPLWILDEPATALDAETPVIFVVWNNRGYREIETSMLDVGVEPVGVSPAPPDFCKLAEAYGIEAERLAGVDGFAEALKRARATGKPRVIEITVD